MLLVISRVVVVVSLRKQKKKIPLSGDEIGGAKEPRLFCVYNDEVRPEVSCDPLNGILFA